MALLSLTDYVPLDILEDIVKRFYESTHMVTNFFDYQGRQIATARSYCDLCKKYRSSEKYSTYCVQCDAIAGMHASLNKRPYLHICHAGLCDVAIPIIINDTYLGLILTGQVRLEQKDKAGIPSMEGTFPAPDTDFMTQEEYQELYERASLFSREALDANAALLSLIGNYVADIGQQKVRQQEQLQSQIDTEKLKAREAAMQSSLAKMELQTLTSQLRPQFMIETFNAIYQQAVIEDASDTAKLVRSLNNVLRRNLDHPELFVTVEDELQYVFNLIQLKNVSRYYEIQYRTSIEPSCMENVIPISTIQSIVENVFLYKIDQMEKKSDINLCATKQEWLEITISCPSLELPVLKLTNDEGLKNLNSYSNTAFRAVNNVRRTLHLCYRDSYNMEIAKNESGVTEFRIAFPAQERSPLLQTEETI